MRLPRENADAAGDYDLYYAPYAYGIYAALDDPEIQEIVCMKAAQVAWTTILISYILKRIDVEPSAIIGMFAGEGAARDFSDEKLVPIIKETGKLRGKIDVTTSKKSGNRALHKNFPGGFLKLISSNAIRSVKSTPAKFVFVEEPDDSNENVKEQGDSVLLLWERTKRQRNPKRILGGTPSVKGFSRVERHILGSDKRVLPVCCHECGDSHVLDFGNVVCDESDSIVTPEFGYKIPGTAVYVCPFCGVPWDDFQRQENIRSTVMAAVESGDERGGWTATANFTGVAGFMELSELYSCLPGAGLSLLVEDDLKAEYRASQGDEKARIVFTNSKLGRPYEYKDERDNAEQLRQRAEDDPHSQHPEKTVPKQGLLLTIGIDVQHDRVELIARAWGREEESWQVLYTALYAEDSCVSKKDPVWEHLESVVFGAFQHESGCNIFAQAISIDSSDGTTSDAVYHWVRRCSKKYPHRLVMAIKGASAGDPEIFTTPTRKSVDHKNPKKITKADKYGIKVFIVGTNRGKDWLASHMKLKGEGAGRFHYYRDVRQDYFTQMCSEIKIPSKRNPNKKTWQLKPGQRCEAWDCENYALHAARAKKIHIEKPGFWEKLEGQLKQDDLFKPVVVSSKPEKPVRRKSNYGRRS